ncbi:MAG: TonB-dependent receptor [Bacteroidales bacterium]|nr:TonB-dependent receptor [Bacteroidales bacterium]
MSYKPVLFIFLIFLPFSLRVNGNSQVEIQDTLRSYTINEAVITANRSSSLLKDTPEAIRIVDHDLVDRYQMRSAPEALGLTPGVFIQKTNHGGGSPIIRGLTGNQTLLLIDGIRLSNATYRYGPNQYLNTIDILGIEKIEVLRGAGSVQYGSDALGGTIQVFDTDVFLEENPVWHGKFLTRFASHNMEQSMHSDVSDSSGKAAFRAGVTGRNFGDIVGGDSTGRQSPTGYQELDFNFRGKVKLSESAELTMVFQNAQQYDVPVYHKVELENYAIYRMDPQKRQLGYVRLNKQLNAGVFKSAKFTAAFQKTGEGRESRKNGSDILRYESDRVRSLSFQAEAFTEGGHLWSASSGFEVYNDLVHSSRNDSNTQTGASTEGRGLYPDGSGMTSIAAYTLNTIDLQKWIFTAGARFNTYVINVEDETIGTAKLTPSALVGNLSVLRKLTPRSNIFISAGTGFRAPNIDDLGTLGIVDFRYEKPNYDLHPENSFQYQAGYKYHGSRVSGEIYLYRNELNNLIVRSAIPGDTIEGYPVYQKENVERAFIEGIETNIGLKPGKSWQVDGSLTYTYGQNITKNEPMRRIPPLFGRVALEYSHKKWWASLVWIGATKQDRLAAGDKSDNRIPSGGTHGWNIFNVNAGYVMKHFQVDFSVENLFNKDYRYHGSGINGYGRYAMLSLTLNI